MDPRSLIDNSELMELMEILEGMDDESLAVELLKELNDASKEQGQLQLNLDDSLAHEEWKSLCDKSKTRVENIVSRIRDLG